MKSRFIKLSKIALFLVCFVFFMPISCDMNGVDLIRMFNRMEMTENKILLLLVFVASIVSILISIAFIKKEEEESILLDWSLLITSILGGVLSIGRMNREYFRLQSGAYTIIAGWILSLLFLICASLSREKHVPKNNNSFSKDTEHSSLSEENVQSNVWVCTKCGATNPVGSVLCQNCGH
ncbi:hypothetical protein [uncultured Treponema sp.]|uniref:hypothetical protein n=1 Tax=uncultured Treponema sp. TaxID=162155 RepID=UPI0025FD0F29|nr:hypothetical protein [uncultured Treponema sp.]